MQALIGLVSVYMLVCAILPALIAMRRGLGGRATAGILAFGLLTGWTGYGAIAAWMFACLEKPDDAATLNIDIVIR